MEWDLTKKNEMGFPKTQKKIQLTWHSQMKWKLETLKLNEMKKKSKNEIPPFIWHQGH